MHVRLHFWKKAPYALRVTFPVILASLAAWLLFYPPSPSVRWTAGNSLEKARKPQLSDSLGKESLLRSLTRSIEYLAKVKTIPGRNRIRIGETRRSAGRLQKELEEFKDRLSVEGFTSSFFRYVRQEFDFYRPPYRRGQKTLFTGYYEATLEGSLEPTPGYPYPVYRTPPDLLTIDLTRFYFYTESLPVPRVLRVRAAGNSLLPYFSRRDIDSMGRLSDPDLVIAWLRDPVQRFFLHIQGSGRITLPDRTVLRVNYAQSNGHPYRAIGRWFIQQGIMTSSEITMQSIARYLRRHPREMDTIFNTNPSYVFFRIVEEGPLGSLGVPVTPFRSIATDRRLFPPGVLCFVRVPIPYFDAEGHQDGQRNLAGFVLNQDTGGAIRSPFRADLFCGSGNQAEQIAGHLKHKGEVYFLIKKE